MAATDPVTLIVPIRTSAESPEPALRAWSEFLQKGLGREYDLILVDDGSQQSLDELAKSLPHTRLLKHDQPRGFGACLRTALAEPTHPVVGYTSLDYPYTPSDLPKLLAKLGESTEIYGEMKTVVAVSGCRTGRPVPVFWKMVGQIYRGFCRVVLGNVPQRINGWLGFREHTRSWLLWATMGNPLMDVNSAFKVYYRSVFDQFPIQSDSDFAHAEIFTKLTHLLALVDEVLLSPSSTAIPRTWWQDYWHVIKDAKFHTKLPDLTKPSPTV